MLKIQDEPFWADFNETEVSIQELENLNYYEICDIPHGKMVLIAHCLCCMIGARGGHHVFEPANERFNLPETLTPLAVFDNYSYLSNCSHGRLRELIKFLIDSKEFSLLPGDRHGKMES